MSESKVLDQDRHKGIIKAAAMTFSSYALRIALLYIVVGGIWILLSDRILAWAVQDVETLTTMQTYKGWFFVTMSALLVYGLSRHYVVESANSALRLRESQDALTESQRTLLTLLGNIPGMAYRRKNDLNWTMEFVSDGCESLTGFTPEEFLTDPNFAYGRLVSPEDRDIVWNEVQLALNHNRAFQVVYRITNKAGEVRWMWEQGCGIFTYQRKLEAIEGCVFDITERTALAEQLKASERLSHIGQAASTIIHDLKNPMQVILGHVELLKLKEDSAAVHQHCEIIEGQIQNIVSLSHELLDFARGNMSLALADVDVQEFLSQLVETYEPFFNRTGVRLRYERKGEPNARPETPLDRDKMWRVIMNIVNNARESMTDGGDILLRSWIDLNYVRFDVEDNGPGIPEQIRGNLFEPFVTKGKTGGTGLGLAIAKRIVDAHHGSITFTTAERVGTTFTIILPRLRPGEVEAATKSRSTELVN